MKFGRATKPGLWIWTLERNTPSTMGPGKRRIEPAGVPAAVAATTSHEFDAAADILLRQARGLGMDATVHPKPR